MLYEKKKKKKKSLFIYLDFQNFLCARPYRPPNTRKHSLPCEKEETPPVDWNSEFGLVRTGMKKVLEDLRGQLAGEDWKEVMNTARNYDISFRKE